jgi:hypothetical protein
VIDTSAKPQKWSSSLASNSALAKGSFFRIRRRAVYLLYYREEKTARIHY